MLQHTRMNRPHIFVASLLVAIVVAPQASAALSACRGMTFVRPNSADVPGAVPDNPIGCRHGISFKPEDGVTLWRCQVLPPDGQDDLPEGTSDYAFLIERPGQPMQVLPDQLMAGRYAAFSLARVDLDGDGTAERVLAAWNAQGNGLGVNGWTIRVFDASWRLLREFDQVSEWGDGSILAAPKGRKGCDLAITAFVDSKNRRGQSGISFQARFFGLKDGRVAETADRPAIERRYDFAFQRQRGARSRRGDDMTGDVVAWLSHPSTIVSPKR